MSFTKFAARVLGIFTFMVVVVGVAVWHSVPGQSTATIAAGEPGSAPEVGDHEAAPVLAHEVNVAKPPVREAMYSVWQDIHPQWCEHTAAGITTKLVNNTCFITIELSTQAYTTIRFHSEGDLVMYVPEATAAKVTFSVTTGITRFWLDVDNPRSPLYTTERSKLQPNCEPGYIGEVNTFMTVISATGGCLAGQPAAFS